MLLQTVIAGSGSPVTPLREISTNGDNGEGEELNPRPILECLNAVSSPTKSPQLLGEEGILQSDR